MKLTSEGASLNVSPSGSARDSQSCVFPAVRQSTEELLACSDLGSPFHQHDMLRLYLFLERLRHLVPHEQIHPERQVAFVERLAQVADSTALLRRGKDNQVEIGLRPRGPLCAGAVDPRFRARQMPLEQRQDGLALPGGKIDGPLYSHVAPVIVW